MPEKSKLLPSDRASLVVEQRQEEYGDPNEIYGPVAVMWSEILSTSVSKEQVALCMIALKLGREMNNPRPDNRTDICGYTNVLEMVQ